MSRYSRSLLWSLMGESPVGDRIPYVAAEALGGACAGEVAEAHKIPAAKSCPRPDKALEQFASHTGGGEGAQLAVNRTAGARPP